MARNARDGLPEVLRSPMLADRLAAELKVAAGAVDGDGPMERERASFIMSAARQIEGLGTVGQLGHLTPASASSNGNGHAPEFDELETR